MHSSPRTGPSTDLFDGITVMAGNWEPLAHRRRAVLSSTDDVDRYQAEHSEEMVTRLLEAGVTAVVWHCFKGLGFEHEKDDMELTRQFGVLCHEHGLKLGTYVNFGSIFTETFFAEMPEARQWLAIDSQGQPHSYSEYFRCYYRQRPCMSSQPYIDYVRRMALYAAEHCNSDWIHFDNNAQMPCYCEDCRRGFRRYLADKYPCETENDHARTEARFGHCNLDNIELPRGTVRMGIDTLSSLHEPVLQEWVTYRCELLAEAIGQVSRALVEKKASIVVGANPTFDNGEFAQLVWGADLEMLAPHTHVLFNEDGNYPRVADDSRLIGHLFSFKLGKALNVSVAVHQPGATTRPISTRHAQLSLLEAAVFNGGNLGHVYHASDLLDGLPADDPRPAAVWFIRDHAEYYLRNDTLAEVALLHSRHSLTNNWRDALQGKIALEQVLARFGYQFDVVLESQLGQLDKYRVLILPNAICLADEHLDNIREFVRTGGAVVATEDTALCDHLGRKRLAADFKRLFADKGHAVNRSGAHCTRQQFLCELLGIEDADDAQRIFHVADIRHTKAFAHDFSKAWIPIIDNHYWRLPTNAADIADIIDHALARSPLVSLPRPSFVVPQLVSLGGTDDVMLHLLNYDVEHTVGQLPIVLNVPALENISTVKVFTLDEPGPQDIQFSVDTTGFHLALPPFKVYAGIIIETR